MTPPPSEHAPAARDLCARERFGTLATLARDPSGYPFASVAAYALGADGQPLLLLSQLAEHTHNLLADSRASLLVTETPRKGVPSPLALARVTLIGDVEPVPPAEGDAAREAYLRVHPEGARYLELDFSFYRLRLRGARYVGGFGRMSWIDAPALTPPP
ncbi:MAG TPA: pyridoxamine 5'-phosphate oxidase family protein [Chloroflexota bacterium]|nr:pyridoxamine 5'-phosphate oxidase family protein [Chloroflexota bacterium]